jgi:hypothetical protein
MYLFRVAIRYWSTALVNAQYRYDSATAHAGHAMLLPARASPPFVVNSRSSRMSFPHVFTVEHRLASRSYLSRQNELRDAFPDRPAATKTPVFCPVNRSRSPPELLTWLQRARQRPWVHASLNAVDILRTLNVKVFVVFSLQCTVSFRQTEHVS